MATLPVRPKRVKKSKATPTPTEPPCVDAAELIDRWRLERLEAARLRDSPTARPYSFEMGDLTRFAELRPAILARLDGVDELRHSVRLALEAPIDVSKALVLSSVATRWRERLDGPEGERFLRLFDEVQEVGECVAEKLAPRCARCGTVAGSMAPARVGGRWGVACVDAKNCKARRAAMGESQAARPSMKAAEDPTPGAIVDPVHAVDVAQAGADRALRELSAVTDRLLAEVFPGDATPTAALSWGVSLRLVVEIAAAVHQRLLVLYREVESAAPLAVRERLAAEVSHHDELAAGLRSIWDRYGDGAAVTR